MIKRTLFAFGAVAILVLLLAANGCPILTMLDGILGGGDDDMDPGVGTSLVVDVIPVFAFSQASTPAQNITGARVIISDSLSWSEAQYYLIAPILTSFENNEQEYEDGDSFDLPVLDTVITLTITGDVSGTIRFDGYLEDGTGEVAITFDPIDRIFSYEQTIIFEDPYNKIGIPGATFFQALVHTTMDSVLLDVDNSFHGKFKSHVFEYFGNESSATSLFAGTEEIELYHGDMLDESFSGTGYAMYQYRSLGNFGEVIPGFAAAPTMAEKEIYFCRSSSSMPTGGLSSPTRSTATSTKTPASSSLKTT